MATEIPGQSHTNKYSIPDALDNGVEYAETIEDFMIRMAKHTHSGIDSAAISLNITKDVTDFESGVDIIWSEIGNDVYEAVVPYATGSAYDTHVRHFFAEVDGKWIPFYPETQEYLVASYKVYSNQPTQNLRVVTI
jgi:hypothetical protein